MRLVREHQQVPKLVPICLLLQYAPDVITTAAAAKATGMLVETDGALGITTTVTANVTGMFAVSGSD